MACGGATSGVGYVNFVYPVVLILEETAISRWRLPGVQWDKDRTSHTHSLENMLQQISWRHDEFNLLRVFSSWADRFKAGKLRHGRLRDINVFSFFCYNSISFRQVQLFRFFISANDSSVFISSEARKAHEKYKKYHSMETNRITLQDCLSDNMVFRSRILLVE